MQMKSGHTAHLSYISTAMSDDDKPTEKRSYFVPQNKILFLADRETNKSILTAHIFLDSQLTLFLDVYN